MQRSVCAWVCLVCLTASVGFGGEAVIVRGDSRGVIVTPANAAMNSETIRGAQEVADYVLRITGVELPLVVEGKGLLRRQDGAWKVERFSEQNPQPAGTVEMHVGWTARALKDVGAAALDGRDMDAFLVRVKPDVVFLVGRNDWGTAYACHEFLERFGDVRWLMPGELWEDVPRRVALTAAETDAIIEPSFRHRQYSYLWGGWRDGAEMGDWVRHNRIRARIEYHHNLFSVFDPVKWAEKYPDLYPIHGGKRRIPGPGNYGAWQPRLSHPKAVETTMEYAREFFKKHPDKGSISLGINDGAGYCETELDKDAPQGSRFARVYFAYANAVAEAFDKEFPDRDIGFLLYGEAKVPPPGVKLHPRLVGFLVCPSYSLITPEGEQKYRELVDNQAQVTPTFGLYDWFYGSDLFMPRLQLRQAKAWLDYGFQKGARHVKAEAYPNWGLDGFKYWVHARLLWDVRRDADALAEEALTRLFRESAKPMRAYFRIVEEYTAKPVMHRTADGQETLANFAFRRPEQFESFPPEAVERCAPLIAEAARLARSHIVRQRVAYYRTGFEIARRMTAQYHLGKEALDAAQGRRSLAEAIPPLAKALAAIQEVQGIYDWRLGDDPHCVVSPFPSRHPANPAVSHTGSPAVFEMPARARMAAVNGLAEAVIEGLRQRKAERISRGDVEDQARQALDAAFARLPDPDSLRFCRREIGPLLSKFVICRRAAAPTLDGKLDDACWQAAEAVSDFDRGDSSRPAAFRTEVRLCHDGERLYVAFRCAQETDKLLLWTTNRDGRVWREDGVEVFLYSPAATKATERFQVVVSARGNLFDYFNGSEKWDGDIRVGTAISPDHYVLEVSIPLKDIGLTPAQHRFVRANLVRNVYNRKQLGVGEALETSVWSATAAGNVDPQAAGWLIFSE